MRDERSAPEPFRYARAARIAERQWGNITTRQLWAIGFSKGAIRWMVDQGLLYRRHRGVFAFGAISPAPEARWAAALLAAGQGSALSHTSAGAFYGQLPVREVIEVVAPTRRRGDERLRIRTPRRFEAISKNGLTVTSPAQTLLDLAATGWPIDRMTHDMAASRLASLDALRTFARNRRGEPGARALAGALAIPHTRSAWERRFLRWVTMLAIPQPAMNAQIGPLTVDCHWPRHDLVVELDSEQTHGSAWQKRDDAERDAWLRARGLEVWRVRETSAALEARLRQRLA